MYTPRGYVGSARVSGDSLVICGVAGDLCRTCCEERLCMGPSRATGSLDLKEVGD